jgi:hypothetical protein
MQCLTQRSSGLHSRASLAPRGLRLCARRTHPHRGMPLPVSAAASVNPNVRKVTALWAGLLLLMTS